MYPYTVEGLAALKPPFAFPQSAATATGTGTRPESSADSKQAPPPLASTVSDAKDASAPDAAASAAAAAAATAVPIAPLGASTINKCYDYDLVGVVIHAGVADAGHYYSYIKTRDQTTGQSRWVEFNDSNVRPFDVRYLPNEAFGGMERQSSSTSIRRKLVEKTKSA